MEHATYIIGIDLGTTNCTMAYTLLAQREVSNPKIDQLSIAQILDQQITGTSLSLPSFLYYPLSEEIEAMKGRLGWEKRNQYAIGSYARDRGIELPTRLIASAKSWLCHSGINRREKILPLEADEKIYQLSPIEACSEVLHHLRQAWDFCMPTAPFKDQIILITVPASFDPSARELVLEAAKNADYPEVVLLEEPQAAFYAWLYTHSNQWRELLKLGDKILVVDIGGGTTDFSLIGVDSEEGNLALKREAVGSHLLLGGDNIDLALAYYIKQKFDDEGHILESWQFQSLIHQSRQAKEKLMAQDSPKTVDITLLGRGSRLIGNTLKTVITQEEAEKIILNGFIPFVEPHDRSPIERKIGIQQIGLPYVQDPRISCQLAKFLSMTGESNQVDMDQFVLPTAVLFNGGTLKASAIRNQLTNLLNHWAKKLNKDPIKELPGADYDFAVSQGAVYYGLARQGHAVRIRGGTSRSYYVGIEEAVPAVPGISPPLKAVCIVPFGMEEGEESELDSQEFALVLGEQATFRFFSHATQKLSNGQIPTVGSVVKNWKQELSELHSIHSTLDKKEGDGKTVRIKLRSKVTELGVLELWCVAFDGRKWKLEFDIRQEKNMKTQNSA